MHVSVVQAGRMPYDQAYRLQKHLVERVKARPEAKAYLVLVEHPPVATIGRSGDATDFVVDRARLEQEGIDVRDVDRGGRTTYHGPGQLVGYPILALAGSRRDVHGYLRALEGLLIATLRRWAIDAERRPGLTGVWTARGKIAAIGVGLTRWVTFHGFALNVDPDLARFRLIHPCGLRDIDVTSMAELLGHPVTLDEVQPAVVEEFCRAFDYDEATVEYLRNIPTKGHAPDGRREPA
jgi:lipoate-protein ligase B